MKHLSLLFMMSAVHTAFAGDPCTPPGSPLSTPPSPRLHAVEQACLDTASLNENASSFEEAPTMDMEGAQAFIKRLKEQDKIKNVNGNTCVFIHHEDDFEKAVEALILTGTKVHTFNFSAPRNYETELPERICELTSLVELNFCGTYARIPKNIGNLKNLKAFFSMGAMNIDDDAPVENIRQMSQLIHFSFLSDTLETYHDFVEYLPNLHTLSIGQATHNKPWSPSKPERFPDHLASARRLITLNLQDHIKKAPAFLSQCINLKNLNIGSTVEPLRVPGTSLTSLMVMNGQSDCSQDVVIEGPLLNIRKRLYVKASKPLRRISVRSPLTPKSDFGKTSSHPGRLEADPSGRTARFLKTAFSIDGHYINCAEDFRNIDIRSGWVTIENPSDYLKSLGIQHGTKIFFGFEEEQAQGLYDYEKDIPDDAVIHSDWRPLSRIFIFENMIENDQKEANIAKATRILTDVMNQLAFEKFKQNVSEAA